MRIPCDIGDQRIVAPYPLQGLESLNRRRFLRRSLQGAAALSAADFLGYFLDHGCPYDARRMAMAHDAAQANDDPHFLIYWFVEGGWDGYNMFNPAMTANHVHQRLANPSDERYRVIQFGKDPYGIYRQGNIRYGYLASPGRSLLKDMAVVSSMHTGTFHSGQRLIAHMGDPSLSPRDDRQDDERSVMQAFAEVYGQPYLLANISWHWWLSDGELNEADYTGRKGFYHALGPVHAHTVYAGTPGTLRRLMRGMHASASNVINRKVREFLDTPHSQLSSDAHLPVVKSYQSALKIYQRLVDAGYQFDQSILGRLFTDVDLRGHFQIQPHDELVSYQSINGQKARTKFAPNTNVQAMMTYELMRAGLSCGFWIESRDIRVFDSHFTRGSLWSNGSPRGMPDQSGIMKRDLWDPLLALVAKLKDTQYRDTGKSLFDVTNIVLTSEFGRSIHGNVDEILKSNIPEQEKKEKIDSQDISAHWLVTSAAFLGGAVRGDAQFGCVGEKTLLAIPVLPDGSLDPAYDPMTGELRPGCEKSSQSFIPGHGDIYATALYLSGINPEGIGHNRRPPLRFIRRDT